MALQNKYHSLLAGLLTLLDQIKQQSKIQLTLAERITLAETFGLV